MKINPRPAWLAVLILFSLAMPGCAGVSLKAEQPAHSRTVMLDGQNTLGQTFTAHYDGLESLHVYLSPHTAGKAGQGQIVLRLRLSPGAPTDLRTAAIPVSQVQQPGYYAFRFPALKDSTRNDYFAQLEIDGTGSVLVSAANPEVYLSGALYQNGQPQEAQLTFNLGYKTISQWTGLLKVALRWALWLLAGLFLFVLPGWALLDALWQGWTGLNFWEQFGLACGASLAIYPLLFLWTDLIGLRLGALYAWLPPLVALVVIAWRSWASIRARFTSNSRKNFTWEKVAVRLRSITWPDLALLVVIGLVFSVRFWVIRSLDLPLWGDSYQHTMMAQLLVDQNGLFDSWAPYAELTTFTYHFGYHTLVAVFHWVTGLDLPQATLWTGQILNGLAVVSLIPLVMRIQRSRWAALAAVALAGLLASMPMMYTNWGRYTQLAGQTILPAAVYLIWAVLQKPLARRRAILPVWIVLGGLALTHYRVLIFALCFYPAFLLLNLRSIPLRTQLMRILTSAIGAGLLFLPWFNHLFAGQIMTMFSYRVTTLPAQLSEGALAYNALVNPVPYLPHLLWLVLPIALGWGFWRRNREFVIVVFWWCLIFLAANPQWFALPGSGVITNFAVMIAIYIPVALVLGPAYAWTVEALENLPFIAARPAWRRQILPAACVLMVLLASLWGIGKRRLDVLPGQYSLGTRADLRAASWIQANLPAESRFLVNAFPAYNDTSVVGSDGGWWLPLIARRQTTLPPLPYTSEQGPFPDYRLWVNRLTAEIRDKGIEHPDVLAALQERGVTHVYVGQLQGSTNSDRPLLKPSALLGSPHYRLVYHQDRVWIFALVP